MKTVISQYVAVFLAFNGMKTLIILIVGLVALTSAKTKPEPNPVDLNAVLDNWHKAAATANLSDYFSCVTDDFVFLGTDPTERWNKEQFQAFCKPHFDQGKGWDFKSTERNWVFSKNKKIAWFDEKLD